MIYIVNYKKGDENLHFETKSSDELDKYLEDLSRKLNDNFDDSNLNISCKFSRK